MSTDNKPLLGRKEVIWSAVASLVTIWLTASILHRASHAPWRCDEDCPRWA